MNDIKPKLMGGIGEINFGKQYHQGNRIYDAAAIAMCVLAQPVGNTGGYSYLYLIKRNSQEKNMNKKVLKVGNLSTGNSQAGTIYRTWGGFPLHCVPELTDMHLVI